MNEIIVCQFKKFTNIFFSLQLRYLQTLNSIASEKNSTIIFPLPIELFRGFMQPNNPNQGQKN